MGQVADVGICAARAWFHVKAANRRDAMTTEGSFNARVRNSSYYLGWKGCLIAQLGFRPLIGWRSKFLRNDVLMTLSHPAEILGPYKRHSLQASVSEGSQRAFRFKLLTSHGRRWAYLLSPKSFLSKAHDSRIQRGTHKRLIGFPFFARPKQAAGTNLWRALEIEIQKATPAHNNAHDGPVS